WSPIRETELVGPRRRESVIVREQKILISHRSIQDETGKVNVEWRVIAEVVDITKCQSMGLRHVVIDPRQPLRAAIGYRQPKRSRSKLYDTAIHPSNRIIAKLQPDRAGRPAQAAQRAQI